MKVLTRKAFFELPAGTIYVQGKPWVFGNLSLKGDSWPGDGTTFNYLNLMDIDSNGTDWVDRLEEMLRNGVSYPRDDIGYGRDGPTFDDDEVFLVFEWDDLVTLRDRIDEAIAILRPDVT